jgi:hypothetical protein
METMASIYLEAAKVAVKRDVRGRQRIVETMREAFEQAGVMGLVMDGVPVAPYTKPGDPFKFDFGYRVSSEIKLFHAVSLKANVEAGVLLAARYPKIAQGIAGLAAASPLLTAVIDDDLDRGQEEIRFALDMMEEEKIRIAPAAEMRGIAEAARMELRV